MKVRVPKRDENGELVYEIDGVTVVYEEKDLSSDTQMGVILNKLGESDTIIDVIVTAEDGVTIKDYKVTIKRPYGTIKGSIQLGENLRDEMQLSYGNYVEYIANATLYKSGLFDWNGIVPKTESLDNLDNLDIQVQVQTDKDEKTLFIQCMIQILLQFHQLVK